MNKHGGYRGDQAKIIDFSVNIAPFGPPESVKQGIVKSLSTIEQYPSIDGKGYRSLLKKGFNLEAVHEEELIIGNGAMELIYLFARSLGPKQVLLVQPTFNEYQRAFELAGARVDHYILSGEMDLSIREEDFMKTLRKQKPEVVVICTPNNPTGIRYSVDTIGVILKEMKKWNGLLFVDESFEEFVQGKERLMDTDWYPRMKENLFLLRSLTKYYGIPGIRLGYGIGGEALIGKLMENKEPWTVNTFAFEALKKIVQDKEYPMQLRQWLEAEKNYLDRNFQILEGSGLKVYPSSTNFYLGKISGMSGMIVQERLLELGIYVRTCEDFRGLDREHFRFAVRTRSDNEKLLLGLQQLLKAK